MKQPQKLFEFLILVIPGGFSYGDDVAAGKILANELKFKLGNELKKFVSEGRMVIGICNGFQVLVRLGLLPGFEINLTQNSTLTQNDSGRFQCEWVGMKKENSKAKWLSKMPAHFELPIAHGEGKFVAESTKVLTEIEKNGQVVFRYHPLNPNGSSKSIAGVCNHLGNVIGLMPHPERFITKYQHPSWTRNGLEDKTAGYIFWESAVAHARRMEWN